MSEDQVLGGGAGTDGAATCPWCSAALPDPDAERCPSCGASLGDKEAEVPGVTRIDHEAILRSRAPAQRSRGLIGWLSGEYQAEAAPDKPGTLTPPSTDVRREMLRLEQAALEAELQARQAELAALVAESGLTLPPDGDAAEAPDDDAETAGAAASQDEPAAS